MGERVRLWPFIRIYVYSDSGPPIYLNKFMTLSAKWQLMRDFRSQHEHVTGVSAALVGTGTLVEPKTGCQLVESKQFMIIKGL